HAAPPFIAHAASHVEPEVDFVEIAMKRHRTTQHTCPQEAKPDDAQESLPVKKVNFRAAWDILFENRRLDGHVEHGQGPPLGREKRARALGWIHPVILAVGKQSSKNLGLA